MTKSRLLFCIPQILTGLRLLAGPFVFWSLLNGHRTLSFWLVCFASISDWLDGASARYLKIESDFGRTFDPVADKVFILCVCVGLVFTQQLPLWLVSIIVLRDTVIVIGGLWIRKKRIPYVMTPLKISKYNTFLQMNLVGWLLLYPLLPYLSFYPLFSNVLIYGTLATTLLSGFSYAKIFILLYCTSKFSSVLSAGFIDRRD
ncbi:MAG: CDP-alcohol phosphatidyltransferase family protein [Candidatus Paracaedibacteraceae bacterium]|nr:CDP-alcohol phosphatidyltransferase family protein [Candidatus Paracaedibacteraceae bacterium]